MELTHDERRMIERLQLERSRWPLIRLLGLQAGVGLFFVSISSFLDIGFDIRTLVTFGVAFYCICFMVGNWSGRPATTLLLKMIEPRLFLRAPKE